MVVGLGAAGEVGEVGEVKLEPENARFFRRKKSRVFRLKVVDFE